MRRAVVLAIALVVRALAYEIAGESGDEWVELSSPPLRAVEYAHKFRIGVAPELIGDQRFFPCLRSPVMFRIRGSIRGELLPPRIVKLEPLEYPEELWQNEDYARIKPYVQMWEARFPSSPAKACGDGLWCAPDELAEGYYLIYTGRSL
ncbi:MAG TPA: hypothetical protein ENF73_01860, partial [Proteobacteria bacterium]|nr:hypothetical protein [Pseudomonadota bacterium]